MGSYATLYVDGFEIGSTKNDIDPVVMILFRSTDRIEGLMEPDDEGYRALRVAYRATAADVRSRLELMGFTRPACGEAVRVAFKRHLTTVEGYARAKHGALWTDELKVYRDLTPEVWLKALQRIHADGLRPSLLANDAAQLPPLIRRMLESSYDDWFGCPVHDVRIVIGMFLELMPDDAIVEYDLSDLAGGGWVDSDSDLIEHAEALLTHEITRAQRVVVLTEGSIDKWILESALQLLRPKLVDYFRFMDFEGARVAGGAGALASMVKAFIGAGIANRIVAVFDNDTAGAEALRALATVQLPPNFAVVRLPDLPALENYPTIGPTGIARANVNGLAASIELYLGDDVLRGDGAECIPVHWRGFNDALRCYQGEVLDQESIHKRFRDKLRRCREDPSAIVATDWNGLEAVIAALTSAVATTAEAEILEFEAAQPI